MSSVKISNLGIVANKVRNILPGTAYNICFPKALGNNILVSKSATVFDTLNVIERVVKATLDDTKKIAQILKADALEKTLKNIHNFFYKHYKYKLDEPGIEQVRRPSRAWLDRATGIDCDCFSTSISSVLTNLGIPHYLKIVAINGRDYYQHVYVVVPKNSNSNMNNKNDYWVLDPVIDVEVGESTSFNKEAKKITKQHLKKMIPLQVLNGLGDPTDVLGNEFEGLDEEINGLGSTDELGISMAFRNRMHKHVKNSIRKVEQNPTAVQAFVEPVRFVRNLKRLDEAFTQPSEAVLMGVLEELSATEDNDLQSPFNGLGAAANTNDDLLYGILFGDLDENMLNSFNGLGKKGRNKSKQNNSNSGKKGFFTKTKNAMKQSKHIAKKFGKKAGAVLKKAGRQIVKNNPISISARVGFITAMRTNLATIAERAYWGLQTKEFALSKGIGLQYYNVCQSLYALIKKTYVNVLKGDEAALKKAILNGRAAKKIAILLKKRGMRGIEELSGLGSVHGLGSAVVSSVAAASSFLAPIIAFIKRNFKTIAVFAKKGVSFIAKRRKQKQEAKSPNESDEVANENETNSEAPSNDINENINESVSQAKSPDETINQNDDSEKQAAAANNDENNETGQVQSSRVANPNSVTPPFADGTDSSSSNKSSSKTPLIIGGLALFGLATVAAMKNKKQDKTTDGLGLKVKTKKSKKSKVKQVKI